MPHRSPARLLAPLALVAASAAIYLVARSELRATPDADRPATTSAPTTTTKQVKATSRKARARRYTVKPGDVLSVIAVKTGVSVDDLLRYNDLQAADSLTVGRRLKLTP